MSSSYNYSSRDHTPASGYSSERQPQQGHPPPPTRAQHILPPPPFELNRHLLNSDDHGMTHPANTFSLPPLHPHPASYPQPSLSFSYQTQPPPNTSQYRSDYHPLQHTMQQHMPPRSHPPPIPYTTSSWEYSEPQRTVQSTYKMDHAPQSASPISFYSQSASQNLPNQTTTSHSSSNHHLPIRRDSNPQLNQHMSNQHLLPPPSANTHPSAHLSSSHLTPSLHAPQHMIQNVLHREGEDLVVQETFSRQPRPVMSINQLLSTTDETAYSQKILNNEHSKAGHNRHANESVDHEESDTSRDSVSDVKKSTRGVAIAEFDEASSEDEAGSIVLLQKGSERSLATKLKSSLTLAPRPERASEIIEISESSVGLNDTIKDSDIQSSSSPKSPDLEISQISLNLPASEASSTLTGNTQLSQFQFSRTPKVKAKPLLTRDGTESDIQDLNSSDSESSTATARELKQMYRSDESTESSGSESDNDIDVMEDPKYNEELVNYMVNIYRRQQRIIDQYEKRCKTKKAKLQKKFFRDGNGLNLFDKENRSSPLRGIRGDKNKIDRRFNRRFDFFSIVEEESEIDRRKQDNFSKSKKIQKQREVYEEEERRKIWRDICRNAIPRMSRIANQSTTSRANNCRKIAQLCQKEARRAAAKTNKSVKDVQTKARQAMRQMLMFWKRNEKEEREMRKKAEKEAMEKMRIEEEIREAKRQQRKLNFLITQTELYSHFVGKKIGTSAAEETAETSAATGRTATVDLDDGDFDTMDELPSLTTFNEINFDEEDEETLKLKARASAQNALAQVKERTRDFDAERKEMVTQQDFDDMNFQNPSSMPSLAEIRQPSMLMCQLKEYQLKGLNWLANLYEQGINGILADEMGLGKTVQSISLMAHLAETHNIWGPFLVIAPSSTLHNWQQEITRFVPNLKPLPYWGNPQDRKILRRFLNKKNLVYSKDAPFHVVITSYQLIVQDKSYFERTKWQYMVLDEAQAIKSSSSNRWKTLLAFQCRNRLLLTGTPIQNSMQELWALLHFIMPTLFDSHQEFSEWFSKDIESHAENKGSLNEHQLKRLHMILKPFMLRRVKKNVQNELGDKIELEVFCELTARQRMLYRGLREKISVAELLEKATSLTDNESVDSLMNLVMQFRKVCNHPELFERADVIAPFGFCEYSATWMISREGEKLYLPYSSKNPIKHAIPKMIYRNGGILNVPGPSSDIGMNTKYLDHLMNIWRPDYIQESLHNEHDTFSFLRFMDTSPSEAASIFTSHILNRWLLHLLNHVQRSRRGFYATKDDERYPIAPINTHASFLIMETTHSTSPMNVENSSVLEHLTNIWAHSTQYELSILDPCYMPKAIAPPIEPVCLDKCFYNDQNRILFDPEIRATLFGASLLRSDEERMTSDISRYLIESEGEGILCRTFLKGQRFSYMRVPAMKKLVMDSGKLAKLDKLLEELKAGGHRVLIYFQMTRMIDLMEEYLAYRQYKYLRLDGSSKISDRRDMVSDWQTRPEIFIFLLSTRAGGLGINLTAADTVIFYDSDWNPTVDQQAMDRAHRLGQTKQVTVYRLITKGTIEERILQRAKQKDEIQKVVISGGEFKQVDFKPREIVSLLLEDDELENKLREQQLKRKADEEASKKKGKGGKRQKKDKDIFTSGSTMPTISSKSLEDMWHEGEPMMFDEGSVSTPSSVSAASGVKTKKTKTTTEKPTTKSRPKRTTRATKKDDDV